MQNGLRLKLIEALKNKYPDYLTIEEINGICHDPERTYKVDNAGRRFRNDRKATNTTIKAVKVWNDKRTAIIGYRHIPDVRESYKSPKETIIDDLNDKLDELLKEFKPDDLWNKADEINKIRKVRNGNDEYAKQSKLIEYGIK
jgi:hypothetical protein